MTKKTLRLGREVARKPVRLTLTIGPDLAEEPKLYAYAYEREYGETQTPSQLAPYMIRMFLASDAGFEALKRRS